MRIYTIEIITDGEYAPTPAEVAHAVRECCGPYEHVGGTGWRVTTLVAGPSRVEEER